MHNKFLKGITVAMLCFTIYSGMAQRINQTEINEGIDNYIGSYHEAFSYVGDYGSGQDWNQTTRRLVSYNVDNQVSEFYQQDYIAGKWENNMKYEYSYGSKAKASSVAIYTWFDEAWTLYINKIYNYNVQGLLTENITQKLKNGTITNNSRINITYNAFGNILEYTQQLWGDNEWMNTQRYVYVYDDNQQMLSFTIQNMDYYDWKNNRVDNYKYDNSGRLTEKESSVWQNDSWQIQSKEGYEYDKWNRQTGLWAYLWIDNNWINDYRHIITYNTQNLVQKFRIMKWSTEQLSFNDYSSTEYKYNSYSNITETLSKLNQNGELTNQFISKLNYDEEGRFVNYEKFKWQANNWVNDIKFQYNYAFVSVDELSPRPNISSMSFPNPFAESTTISFKLDKQSPVFLRVFDVSGNEVAVLETNTLQAGDYNYPFSANDLRSGTYFYQLTVGNNVVYKPITIID